MIRTEGLWQSDLIAELARLGHGEIIVIVDAGFPIPPGVRLIDVAITRNVPTIMPVLESVLATGVFECASIATELEGLPHEAAIANLLAHLPVTRISHEQVKALSVGARVIIRSGDAHRFSNVVLQAGVDF